MRGVYCQDRIFPLGLSCENGTRGRHRAQGFPKIRRGPCDLRACRCWVFPNRTSFFVLREEDLSPPLASPAPRPEKLLATWSPSSTAQTPRNRCRIALEPQQARSLCQTRLFFLVAKFATAKLHLNSSLFWPKMASFQGSTWPVWNSFCFQNAFHQVENSSWSSTGTFLVSNSAFFLA